MALPSSSCLNSNRYIRPLENTYINTIFNCIYLYIMMGCFKFLKDIEYLKKRIIEINKQIDNIYEILEFFTNESKRKNLDESNSNVFTKKN